MLVAVRDDTVTFVGADGGCVSAQGVVVTAMFVDADELPAASYASTPTWYAVPQVRLLKLVFVCGVVPTRLEPRYTP